MQQAGFEPQEIDLILHLREQADMQFGSPPHIAHAFLASGIRQGCSLSPLLWSLSTGLIYKQYAAELEAHRLKIGTSSLYVFSSWLFKDQDALKRAVRAMGFLIHVLRGAGLQLSVDKTVIMLTATGTSVQSALSRYRHEIEGVPHFKVMVGQTPVSFKLVQEHTTMDLEPISHEELMEAAADLQALQTAPKHSERERVCTQKFGSLTDTETPTKYNRPDHKGQQRGGKGRNQDGQMTNRRAQPSTPEPTRRFEPGPRSNNPSGSTRRLDRDQEQELLQQMATVVLRHEDQLSILKQSTGMVAFLGTAPPLTVIPLLQQVGDQWRTTKESDPTALKHPIRLVLFQAFTMETPSRIQKLDTCPDSHRDALRLSIITETGRFPYQAWNRQTRASETVDTQQPLEAKEILHMLDELMILSVQDGVLPRFHPTRDLAPRMEGPTVTWMIELGLRNPKAYRTWELLERLSGNSVLRLVAASLRRERLGRSAAAKRMAQLRRQGTQLNVPFTTQTVRLSGCPSASCDLPIVQTNAMLMQ
ncbi:unnamed protein product, partial [Symbiodinium necroappetens]